MMNVNNNVVKNCKIKEGLKYYELNVKNDYYFINITNLPKENLIRFKLFLKKLDYSNKENIIAYENDFNLEYFSAQTQFLNELGIKTINDLINFFQTYFSKYNDNKEESLINYIKDNPNLVILKLSMFENKIQISIELNQKIANPKPEQINFSTCKNFNINIKKKLISKEQNSTPKNISNTNNILLTEYHISLIKKRIPYFKYQKKNFKLNLIYKSSSEKEKNFHKKCDNKGSTLIIIFTKENRMFLTFNKKSWIGIPKSEINKIPWREINVRDDDIFILDLFSKKILKNKDIKKNEENNFKFLEQYENNGPAYVDKNLSFKIIEEDKYLTIEFITKNIDEINYIKSNYNLEKNNFLHIQDYEVYNIIDDNNNAD